jgi:nicotinate-nucleotide adenylyltransferase
VSGGERIGLLGGTFDPPHIGHLVAAVNVRHALGLDRVLLVVANEPWQKVATRHIVAPVDRLAMVEALVEGVDGIEASGLEIERGGPSYTVDTVEQLRVGDPRCALFVILGRDAAAGLPTWERVADLQGRVVIVVVERPGSSHAVLPAGWSFEHVEVPRVDASSTDMRRRIAEGQPIDGLVPAGVISVMRERGLYRGWFV